MSKRHWYRIQVENVLIRLGLAKRINQTNKYELKDSIFLGINCTLGIGRTDEDRMLYYVYVHKPRSLKEVKEAFKDASNVIVRRSGKAVAY